MNFSFESRQSDSPFVDGVWRTQSEASGSFISLAESHWGMVVTRQRDKLMLTVRGPETKAMLAPVPENAEFFGIVFKHGVFMPHLPARSLVDSATDLPEATNQSFKLHGVSWQFPTYENADTFINRLVHDGLLVHDPVVDSVLRDHPQAWSIRTIRRRFLFATGLTHKAIQQIERARHAVALLQQGTSILDTVNDAGYFDQPHLTRSLKHFMGQTPAEIVRMSKLE